MLLRKEPVWLLYLHTDLEVVLSCQTSFDHLEPRIVGGDEVEIENCPFTVVILLKGNRHCGGAILNPFTIVTAAHCFAESDELRESFLVRAGTPKWDTGGSDHYITLILCHPNYKVTETSYDMAHAFIEPSFIYDETRKPILIPEKRPLPGDVVTLLGFGALSHNKTVTNHLQSVTVPVLSPVYCTQFYKDFFLRMTLFCFGTVGHGACSGDSGGPVIRDGELVGIVVFAFKCTTTSAPVAGIDLTNRRLFSWLKKAKI